VEVKIKMSKTEMISEKRLRNKLSKEVIDLLKAKMEWKQLKGNIEVTINVKTTEDLEKRLNQIAEQIISQNRDVYKTRWEKPNSKKKVVETKVIDEPYGMTGILRIVKVDASEFKEGQKVKVTIELIEETEN